MDLTALAHQDQGLNDDGEPLGEADTEVREEFRKRAVPMMFDETQKSMKDFRVNFDVWSMKTACTPTARSTPPSKSSSPAATSSTRTAPLGLNPPSTATTRTV